MSQTRKIVFATNNNHKLREIREIIGNQLDIVSLEEIGCKEDLPETADTIAGNAIMKARYIAEHYGIDCFADDTGLEVEVLGGEPGVHTARYAPGSGHDNRANVDYLLANLADKTNRKARFVTVIALVENGSIRTFEGVCEGQIANERRGVDGFGYDPVFVPSESNGLTFAEMGPEEKNRLSHRGKATRSLVDYLSQRSTDSMTN